MIRVEKTAVCGKVTKCFHHCLYCLMGAHTEPVIPWEAFTAAAERFVSAGASFELNNNYDLPADRFEWYVRTSALAGKKCDSILMGGMRMKTYDETVKWLAERQALGVRKAIFSMAGPPAFHDRMNGRTGDYGWLKTAQKAAFSLGMDVDQRIFVTKENLAVMSGLCHELDKLGEPSSRDIYPLHYRGRAKELEELRIEEKDVGTIPPGVLKYMRKEELKTESEWSRILKDSDRHYAKSVDIHIRINALNLDRMLSAPCDEILEEAKSDAEKAFDALPDIRTLCEKYAETDSRKIYEGEKKMLLVWLERYVSDKKNSIPSHTAETLRTAVSHS